MKRWRTTLIVLGVFAALTAYILLVEVKRQPPAEPEAAPTPLPLLDMDIENVQSLDIVAKDKSLHVEHPGQEWQIILPGAAAPEVADPYVVHLAVDDLVHLSADRVLLEQATNLAQYSLEPAALTLTLTSRTGEQTQFLVGKQTVDGLAYYVQRAGDPRVFLVKQYTLQPFFNWLDTPPYEPTPEPTPIPAPGTD